jgi:CheY-like chemotaxis protein
LQNECEKEKIRLNKEHIDIFLNFPPDQKIVTIYTDPGRLQQVLAYLLDNALKYTEKGYIQFGYELKENRNLQFFVKDTGIGISKEVQKYIFNRYRYGEDTLDKKLSTSGLSLTIAKAVVELLGGRIHVESIVNEGSTFSFTLPIHKVDKIETDENIVNADIPSYNWKNKVILVAEDEEINFKFIEAILANTQAQLLHVSNGEQAIELCKSINKIDLVLMDIKMPGLNGYDAVREIKKIRKDLPVIAQTAYTFKEEKFKCKDAGCDDYISKPIYIEQLIKKINKFFTN